MTAATHTILVGAPRDIAGPGMKPALLQRSDADFVNATLDDLRSAGGRGQLGMLQAGALDAQGGLKLFQPIQRQFHLVLTEAWCDVPGQPRIAPARVDAAGMVLRRIGADGLPEGWMKSRGRVRGWIPIARVGGDDADPASAQRLQLGMTGVADIDRQLTVFAAANADNALNESVVAMYLAPPDVCADAGKTLFYGVVPTVSSEISEQPATFDSAPGVDFGPQSTLFQNHLVQALRGQAMDLPSPGDSVDPAWLVQADQPGADPTLVRFVNLIRQLASEFNAFDGGADAAGLRQALQAIVLPLVQLDDQPARSVSAGTFLGQAADVILGLDDSTAPPEVPATWPALSDADAAALASALHDAMTARFASMKGQVGRFDELGAHYVLRAFVRLKADGACPPRVVWSDYSDPFTIAPWYDGAGAPPVQIALPDPSDRNLLKSLKPNVAFVVPPSLQSLLGGSATDSLKGNVSSSPLGLTWICGFNIPVITICAFLVLNIFLSLFNIVFGWMFFMKICLPFPKVPPK